MHLSQFRGDARARKRLAETIKALRPELSNRQIARALGVDHKTIGKDLWNESPRVAKKPNGNSPAVALVPAPLKTIRNLLPKLACDERRQLRRWLDDLDAGATT